MKRIPFTTSLVLLQIITVGVLIYHLSILIGLVPYQNVWGGRLTSQEQMIQFESVSIFTNGFFLLTLYLKKKKLERGHSTKIANMILWSFVLLYILNTLGNILSISSLEMKIFTPITILLAFFTARVALE